MGAGEHESCASERRVYIHRRTCTLAAPEVLASMGGRWPSILNFDVEFAVSATRAKQARMH